MAPTVTARSRVEPARPTAVSYDVALYGSVLAQSLRAPGLLRVTHETFKKVKGVIGIGYSVLAIRNIGA